MIVRHGEIINMNEDILTDKDISKMVCDVCGMTGVKLKNMKQPKGWLEVKLMKNYTHLFICDTCARMMVLFAASSGKVIVPIETIEKYFPNFHVLNKDEPISMEGSELDTIIKEEE